MPSAVNVHGRLAGRVPGPRDFWSKVKSLQADARQVQAMSPEVLLITLEQAPEAPARQASLLKEVEDLEHAIQQIRQRLERAVGNQKTGAGKPHDEISTMIARGDLLDSAAFADRLGWTRQALSKALAASRVFFVEHGRTRYFPAFYADKRFERRHLESVSKLLGDLPGGAKLQFFLNPRGSLNKATPLQALAKGQLSAVKTAAECFVQG